MDRMDKVVLPSETINPGRIVGGSNWTVVRIGLVAVRQSKFDVYSDENWAMLDVLEATGLA